MTRDLVLGIDAGTSVTKVVAFDTSGHQLAAAALPNRYENLPGGGCEQDVLRTWEDCAAVLRELGQIVPNLAARVIAMGVTAQGDGTWLIDKDGLPTTPAWLWLDSRSAAIVSMVATAAAAATALPPP